MPDIVIRLTDEALARFQAKLGPTVSLTNITEEALTLYTWAVEQRSTGRLVVSCDKEGGSLLKLELAALEGIDAPSGSLRH